VLCEMTYNVLSGTLSHYGSILEAYLGCPVKCSMRVRVRYQRRFKSYHCCLEHLNTISYKG